MFTLYIDSNGFNLLLITITRKVLELYFLCQNNPIYNISVNYVIFFLVI